MLGHAAKSICFPPEIPASHTSPGFQPPAKILIDTIPKLESPPTHTKQTAKPNSNRYKTGATHFSSVRRRKPEKRLRTRRKVLADMPNVTDSTWLRHKGGFKLKTDFRSR